MADTRPLPLADILSIITGRRLGHGHPRDIDHTLKWMTGYQVAWWRRPRLAVDACTTALVEQHPFLAELEPPLESHAAELLCWVTEMEAQYGATLTVTALDEDARPEPTIAERIGALRAPLEQLAVTASSLTEAARATEAQLLFATHPELAALDGTLDNLYPDA